MRVVSRQIADLDSHTRLLVVIGSVVVYCVLFTLLYPYVEETASSLYLLVLVIASWAFGLRGGVIMALVSLPLVTLLLVGLGAEWNNHFLVNRLTTLAVVLMAGAVVGWLFDIRDQLEQELKKRQQSEARERDQDAFAGALRSVSTALNDTLDSQEVFDRILMHLDQIAPHDAARIVLIENGSVKIVRQNEHAPQGYILRLPVETEAHLLELAETGHAAEVVWPPSPEDELNDMLPARSSVAAPISLEGHAIGFLILYSSRAGVFSDMHAQRLQVFANQAAIAIRNAQMYDALESNVIELETLYNATSVLLTAGSMDEIAREIAQAVALHIETADCAVWLLEGDTDEMICRAHIGPQKGRPTDALHVDSNGPIQEALNKGQSVYIPNFARDPRYALNLSDIRSELVIPLRGKSDIVGVLDLRSQQIDAFSSRDQRILGAFAERATIAIDNMRLYDTLHQFALDREEQVIERTAELNRAKERVEAILNSSSDTIILTLPDGKIQQSNQAFYDLFGYQIDEEFNWMLTWLMAEDSQEPLTQVLLKARESRRPQRLELTASRKDGTQFEADLVLSPIHERLSGGCWGIVCSLRDISERKRMEQELREALVKERELRELKTRFISMASHEFRTPLATIMATASLLRNYFDRMDEAKKARQFEKIEQQINYMTGLLNDVLTIGRMEAGKTPVDMTPMFLHEFFEEMAEEFEQTQPEHQLSFHSGGQPRQLEADSKLMREIISNLLTNAAKYSPQGSTVHVDLDYRPDEVIFAVRDEGIGIPEKDQVHLFEAFHRAENVGTTPGTGLGLSIVKHAVETHGGTIDVDSKVNEGTTFTVRLPLQLSKGQVS